MLPRYNKHTWISVLDHLNHQIAIHVHGICVYMNSLELFQLGCHCHTFKFSETKTVAVQS